MALIDKETIRTDIVKQPAEGLEDKKRYSSCLQRLESGNPAQPETINSKWYKEHVFPRSHWKPSEEQMKALKEALETYKGFEEYDVMKSLYNDLKKLGVKEEPEYYQHFDPDC